MPACLFVRSNAFGTIDAPNKEESELIEQDRVDNFLGLTTMRVKRTEYRFALADVEGIIAVLAAVNETPVKVSVYDLKLLSFKGLDSTSIHPPTNLNARQ